MDMSELDIKVSTSKYNANRRDFELTIEQKKEICDKIYNVILTKKDGDIIQEKINNSTITDYKRRKDGNIILKNDFIKFVYIMRYKLKLPAIQIASYIGMSIEMIFHKMKALGWSYSPKEAQQIAGKKSRNYSEIRIKSKQTMLLSTSRSPIEDKIREFINLKLAELLPKCDIIVGCNNLSILYEIGKEIDIPIIIFKGKNIHKFAIEINGDYWHQEEDIEKKALILSKGYKYYEIWQCTSNEQREEKGLIGITEDLEKVIQNIIKDVKQK